MYAAQGFLSRLIGDRMTNVDRDPLDALGALGDPTRRRLYDLVSRLGRPVGRDEAAAEAGVGRTLAAYHLDRLAAEGLLTVTYERRSGRTGPGAGRPAKLYERSEREIAVSVPPRDYGVAARLLADAAAADADGATRRALLEAAERLGREIAEEPGELEPVLRGRGYEPFDDGGVTRLRNCPFHAVARRHPDVVCQMNLALLGGVVAGRDVEAVLEPAPGRCCVALRPRAA
jgi:predicted ArsR family transcriptional regulator